MDSGAFFVLAAVEAAAAGDDDATGDATGAGEDGVSEKNGRFAGEGDGAAGEPAGVAAVMGASFFFERFCFAGLGEAAAAGDSAVAAAEAEAAGDGDGEVDASFSVFLERFVLAGLADAAGAGDWAAAAVAAGDASFSFFLECFFLAGLGDVSAVADGAGLCAVEVTMENAPKEIAIARPINLFMV